MTPLLPKIKKKDKTCFMNTFALVQSMAINVDFIEWFASYYEFRLEQMEGEQRVCACICVWGYHKLRMLNQLDYRSIYRYLVIA